MSAAQTWKKVSGEQPQSSVLNFDLYNIFANDWVENITGLFTKFVADFKKKKKEKKKKGRLQKHQQDPDGSRQSGLMGWI